MHESARISFCGHVSVFVAQGGRPFFGGSALVELKMAKDVDSMDRMIRLQLKLTPRNANLAMRTRVLIFCWAESAFIVRIFEGFDSTAGRAQWGVPRSQHTRSLACSISVAFSLFSRISSSRKVGLRGLRMVAGVPGTLRALLSGDFGAAGMSPRAAAVFFSLIYPKPTSPGAPRFSSSESPLSTGECTVVASAKRGVRGGLASDDVDDEESVDADRFGVKFRAAGRFFSSPAMVTSVLSYPKP